LNKILIFFILCFSVNSVFAAKDFPFIGEVQVNQYLNVRASSDISSRKLGALHNKDRVIVLGEDNGFFKLQFPKQLKAWVAGSMLLDSGNKESDTVIRRKVNVRSGPSLQYPVIANLDKGNQIKVLEKNKKDWVRITPPTSAIAWASKKYIKVGESVAVAQAREESNSKATNLMKVAINDFNACFETKIITAETYTDLKAKFEEVTKLNTDNVSKAKARDYLMKLKEFRHLNEIREAKEEQERLFLAKQDELKAKHEAELADLKKKKEKPVRKYDYEGFVDDIGGIMFRPATHKLKKGNKVVLYLKSEDIDLDEYVDKRVGVIGEIKRFRGWGKILIVKEIDLLYAPPSQFWTEEEVE